MAPVALVTGAAGDIGRAIAVELASRGADLALCDLASEPPQIDGARGVHYRRVDISDPAAVDVWLDEVCAQVGVPSWIVPNAAQVTTMPLLEIPADAWERELAVNLTGAFLTARAAARRLVAAQKSGAIVFVGSWAARAPHPALPAYCVAKAGLRMLMECLALELAPHEIRVNEVAPGYVDAGLSKRIFDATPGLRDSARARVPLRSLIAPEEVARQVAWLLSDDAAQITGHALVADGGLSLRTPADER